METLATVLFYLGVITYSVATTLFFVDLAMRDGAAKAGALAPWVLGVGAALHFGHVVTASLLTNICPVESMHFGLSLAALIATLVYLLFKRRLRLHAIGAFVAPLALTFLVGAQFVGQTVPRTGLSRTLLALHVTANLMGVGLFLLAGAAGTFYLVQERRLKHKHMSVAASKLPPLDALDRTEHRLLLAGFPLLTFGVVSGGIFIEQLSVVDVTGFLRAVLGYASWLLVAGVLILRALVGWRGKKAAYGTLLGAVCVLLVILVYVLRPLTQAAS